MTAGRCAGVVGRGAGGGGQAHEDSQLAHDLVAEEKFAGVVRGFNFRLGLLDADFGGRSSGGGFHFGYVLGGGLSGFGLFEIGPGDGRVSPGNISDGARP